MHLYLKWAAQSRALRQNPKYSAHWIMDLTVFILESSHQVLGILVPVAVHDVSNSQATPSSAMDSRPIRTIFATCKQDQSADVSGRLILRQNYIQTWWQCDFASSQQRCRVAENNVAKTTVGCQQSHWWRMKYAQEVCFKFKLPNLLQSYRTLKARQVFAPKCLTQTIRIQTFVQTDIVRTRLKMPKGLNTF